MKRALLAAAALAAAGAAFAHAFMDRALPAVGATVRGSPAEVRLRFTETLGAASAVRVLDTSGRQVDRKDARVDREDAALLRVSLPPLAPGTYRVLWRVVTPDSHTSEGDYTFVVAP
jgi:copper resistance protein C